MTIPSVEALTTSGGSVIEIVDLSGGSVASVRPTEEVSGLAAGGSRVTVHGDAQMNVESTGGSTVNRG